MLYAIKQLTVGVLKNLFQKIMSDNGKNEEQEEEFSVEKIIDKRIVKGKTEYYLKWKGYPDEENTWEPVENLDCDELIDEFERKRAEKEAAKKKPAAEPTPPAKKKPEKAAKLNTSAKEETPKIKKRKPEEEEEKPQEEQKKKKAVSTPKEVKVKKDEIKGFDRGLDAEKIIGATDSSGELMFLMKWKGIDEADLVPAKVANVRCPQIVIKFYEERLTWHIPTNDDNAE
ncbi:chromobox protein homolog 1 isoform X1 [Nilaparvata lugens]|uniref:chromobox protein homolog 1 isoform X1 n=2 Tax=Nilaparvata lugens TaxID=108931 RepID=UPI000B99383D|nr:chromobox protein homolog 1 isoform X1 [Nilaparvata lugens]XP_022193410.1 chromobox protein homolog 1 isoform X1 [Nilaparvata lugens]